MSHNYEITIVFCCFKAHKCVYCGKTKHQLRNIPKCPQATYSSNLSSVDNTLDIPIPIKEKLERIYSSKESKEKQKSIKNTIDKSGTGLYSYETYQRSEFVSFPIMLFT